MHKLYQRKKERAISKVHLKVRFYEETPQDGGVLIIKLHRIGAFLLSNSTKLHRIGAFLLTNSTKLHRIGAFLLSNSIKLHRIRVFLA